MKNMLEGRKKHPAPFSTKILDVADDMLAAHSFSGAVPKRTLDPFAGIGGIADLREGGEIYGVEIEPEWATQARERGVITHVGDSRCLPWPDGYFGAVCTSPTCGNHLADDYAPDISATKHKKRRKRRSYRTDLERPLTPGNSGAHRWGEEYRALHLAVWAECVRVLHPGGLMVLNTRDHFRKRKHQAVTSWHLHTLDALGLRFVDIVEVLLWGELDTAPLRKRGVYFVDNEWVIVLRKP